MIYLLIILIALAVVLIILEIRKRIIIRKRYYLFLFYVSKYCKTLLQKDLITIEAMHTYLSDYLTLDTLENYIRKEKKVKNESTSPK